MTPLSNNMIHESVRKRYAEVAQRGASSCCSPPSSCGGEDVTLISVEELSERLGYSAQEIAEVPEGANMALGCGNPQVIASLKPDEVVLDLGSGGGFDCFLAARQVGETGQVIGVDMTPEMISKARANATKGGYKNVEFRLGEIENIPVADNTIDVIISNCVINLSPDKPRVFREAFRVLKPGGRLAISDVVATATLPGEVRQDLALYTGCMAGAALIDELEDMLKKAGFHDIRIQPKDESHEFIREWAPGKNIQDFVVSAILLATKPRQ